MSVDLKNSETLKNLMRAFAGESQARNRYTFAASVCRQQKLHVVEAVFRFTADQEKEHAEIFYNHMKELAGQTVAIDGTYPVDLTNDVKELLRKAQHNEYEEHDPVYKTFGDVAQQEGFSAVAASFHKIAEIEQAHGNRFGRLADLLEQGKLFVSDVQCAWMCLNCGYIFEGAAAPKVCPPVPRRPLLRGYALCGLLRPDGLPRRVHGEDDGLSAAAGAAGGRPPGPARPHGGIHPGPGAALEPLSAPGHAVRRARP